MKRFATEDHREEGKLKRLEGAKKGGQSKPPESKTDKHVAKRPQASVPKKPEPKTRDEVAKKVRMSPTTISRLRAIRSAAETGQSL